MRNATGILLVLTQAGVLSAQLLPEQRVADFQNVAALYAKRYAPYEWKKRAFGYDALDLKPWLDRIKAAKSDLEFYEIEAEYVANLQDTHTYLYMTSSFRADLGITVDLYDWKVLIDGINRSVLPAFRYPFAIGDELVSLDGKTAEEWITEISRFRKYGNPETTRRNAAGQITVRSQTTYPRAAELGDTAMVEIRRANGTVESYELPWTKTGLPVTKTGPTTMPRSAAAQPRSGEGSTDEMTRLQEEMHAWKLPDYDPLLAPIDWALDADGQPRKFVTGIGSRIPVFRLGLPSSFTQRLGSNTSDFHFSGTYTSGGKTIGYIRIPSFSPPSTTNAVRELEGEITYMERNTDGLVVDVMRNPGGGCYMYDVTARLTPYPFSFFGEEIRATQDRVNSMQSQADLARALRYDEWIVSAYQDFANAGKEALAKTRGMTWPVPACGAYNKNWPPTTENNVPADVVYTKPMIVLIDSFSISAADIFPSMIQDNRRAALVGMRTSGGGGSVSAWPAGLYSETIATNTNTLVVRAAPIVSDDLPTAPYVENIGARPDIIVDYMTRENLMNGGRTFVEQFTQVILDEIAKKR